jgi:hypothetical protein
MAGVSLDGILIGFAVAVLVARTMDGHLQAGFHTIAQGLAEIREELRVGQGFAKNSGSDRPIFATNGEGRRQTRVRSCVRRYRR